MRSLLVRYVLPVALGVFGMLLGLGAVHAYTDHQALHQIIGMINAAQQQKPAVPPVQ